MKTSIDGALFRVEITRIAEHIVRLKRLLRTTWTRPMAEEQQELAKLKLRATELCALRAYSRGKFHIQKGPGADFDPELYHRRIAERLGPAFAVVVEKLA